MVKDKKFQNRHLNKEETDTNGSDIDKNWNPIKTSLENAAKKV